MPEYLIDHSRKMYPLSSDFYMYEGCHDSPFMITGDCYPRLRAWEKSIASQAASEIRAKRKKRLTCKFRFPVE